MNKNGPIVIIEDDSDDQEILSEVFENLDYPNEVIFFGDGEAALDYLTTTDIQPFLIISDINLPKLDGLALRKKLKTDAKLEIKCIPYLFFTTTPNRNAVMEAYGESTQGFFIKPVKVQELEDTIKLILDYWSKCASPNHV